jgi:hypothetical protein
MLALPSVGRRRPSFHVSASVSVHEYDYDNDGVPRE